MAEAWFVRNAASGWATCPLTENGFVQILSRPAYPNSPGGVSTVIALLRQFCSLETHRFWPDELSIREMLATDAAVAPSQLSDVYLLALAVHHRGRFATLDTRIPAAAIRGGLDALEIIAA